jgi:4-aminobutyrate aminotransferase-like enzyme
VAHIGHSNPEVVEAISKQAATLNTNTRYIHENIVQLAEQLTATLDNKLEVCYFCCSGSEANDLALQIARDYTQQQGCLVTKNAYHGNTSAVFQMSPEDCPKELREDWVGLVGGPREYLDNKEKQLTHSFKVAEELKKAGHAPAAFITDNIFSSEGVFSVPEDYLKNMYDLIKSFNGLTIADEVQSGFGRTGEYMWGFQHDHVVPDIVTLGKPMGNGHPIAAVITTHEIAQAFNKKYGYFNTFGGNPVAAAAGLAVITYIQKHGLIEHSKLVGSYFKEGLERLAGSLNMIQEVRGSGLFIGVELRSSSETSEALEGLLVEGILVGQTGPDNNVIKLRPPITFKKEHADIAIQGLKKVLTLKA